MNSYRTIKIITIVAVPLYVLAAPAYAGIQVSVSAASSFPGLSNSDAGPITATTSISEGPASASAFGNLDLGLLRVAANSAPTGLDTRAETILVDTFAFSAGASGFAFLDWSFDGSILAAKNPSTSSRRTSGNFQITVSSRSSLYRDRVDLYEFGCSGGWNFDYGNCIDGTAVNVARSIPIAVSGDTFTVQVSAAATSSFGDVANFLNTGRLFLRLPDSVTITSGSGLFLASASPVPEPSSLAFLLSGGLLLAALRRQQTYQ